MVIAFPIALVLFLPALAGLVWLTYRPDGAARQLPGDWRRIVAPALRPLMAGRALLGSVLSLPLLLVIWAALVFAVARPGVDSNDLSDFSNIAGRVIALDLGSGADIHAQRLAVSDLLDASPRIPTALVVATADAFNVVPLTTDRAFIDRYLNVIEPAVMPLDGRSLPVTLAHGEAVLTRAGIVAGQLILLTGGTAPKVEATPAGRWQRAVVIAAKERADWESYADDIDARLATHDDLGPVVDDLARSIDRAQRNGNREGRLDLTPFFIGAALLLWLGLFRRRKTT